MTGTRYRLFAFSAALFLLAACGEPEPASKVRLPPTLTPGTTGTPSPDSTPGLAPEASVPPNPVPATTPTPASKPTPTPPSDESPSRTATPTVAPTPTLTLTATPTPISPYEDLLGLVPDTPETRSYVLMNDYALIRKLFDLPLPGPLADPRAMAEYYDFSPPLIWSDDQPDYTALQGPFLSDGYSQWRHLVHVHRQRYLAFDIRNEDQTMVAGTPPRQMEVLRGGFDPDATDRALSFCSGECTPPDTRENYEGVSFYSWGEDNFFEFTKILAPPAYDRLGRGGRIAVQDRYVFHTVWTDGMKSVIDASLNERPSLADREEFRLLAGGMSELGAYGVFLTDQSQGLEQTLKGLCQGFDMSAQDCARLGTQLEDSGPMLRPYQVFATGVGKDEVGAYTALVLVHADEGSARDNVRLLRRRIEEGRSLRTGLTWAEFFDTDELDVVARGRVLLARLRPAGGRRPLGIEWAFQRDPLLLHEAGPGFALPTFAPVAPLAPTVAPVRRSIPTAAPALPPTPAPAPPPGQVRSIDYTWSNASEGSLAGILEPDNPRLSPGKVLGYAEIVRIAGNS